jgi:outer membrane protein OmpA-like peptidoglycan-associated protein
MNNGRAIAAIAACAVTLACAARSTHVSKAGPHDLIVLLPDPGNGGTVGSAVVSTPAGSVELNAPRDATTVARNEAPAPVAGISDADVRAVFGGVLANLPPPPQSFTLYFRFDSEELIEESRAVAQRVLQVVKERPFPEVVVRGHTDTTGTAAQNFELGLKRANTVRALLVSTGVDPAFIDVVSHGESDLLVRTPDGVFEPRNRRVEITVR